MDEEEYCYCHIDDTDEYHDCLDYMGCEECPYYYADLDQESGMMERLTENQSSVYDLKAMNSEWCNKYCEQQRNEVIE